MGDGVLVLVHGGCSFANSDPLPAGARVERLDNARSLESILAQAPGADVVLIRAGASLGSGWLACLREVAYGDTICATASALAVQDLKVHDKAANTHRPLPETQEPGGSPPVLIRPVTACVYVRRDVLDLALANRAELDREESATAASRITDALATPGLVHKLDPRVVVGLVDAPLETLPSPQDIVSPAVGRAMDHVAISARGPEVLIDARCLDRPLSGTQVQILNLIRALGETGEVDLHLFLPRKVHPSSEAPVADLPNVQGHYTRDQLPRRAFPIIHRPYQLASTRQIGECQQLGRRLILTQQDMILVRTPSYYSSFTEWQKNREGTFASWLAADHVAFFSQHAAIDAASDAVLTPNKASVVPLGVDHLSEALPSEEPPEQLVGPTLPFMLVLGNSFMHKNRLFALRLIDYLRRVRGWDGRLVLAGGSPTHGSSVPLEHRYLRDHPELLDAVVDVGPVSEAQKYWLYRNSGLVLFPTLYEGFGLVPFEAAALGTPCIYARRSALAEFLPSEAALLDGWQLEHIGEAVLDLFADEGYAASLCNAVTQAGRPLTWARTAHGYLDVYRRVLDAPISRTTVPLDVSDFERHRAAISITEPEEIRIIAAYRRSPLFRTAMSTLIRSARLARKGLRLAR